MLMREVSSSAVEKVILSDIRSGADAPRIEKGPRQEVAC